MTMPATAPLDKPVDGEPLLALLSWDAALLVPGAVSCVVFSVPTCKIRPQQAMLKALW